MVKIDLRNLRSKEDVATSKPQNYNLWFPSCEEVTNEKALI